MAQTQLEILLSARDEASAKLLALQQQFKNLDKEMAKQRGGGSAKFDTAWIASWANELATAAGRASELSLAVRTGTSTQEAFNRAIADIPIAGAVSRIHASVVELVTGEQAAIIQSKKLADSLHEVDLAYRAVAQAASLRGVYGEERQSRQGANAEQNEIAANAAKRAELTARLAEIEETRRNVVFNLLTDEQKQEEKLLQQRIDATYATDQKIRADRKQAEDDMGKDAADRQHEFLFQQQQERDRFEAEGEEKALRRSGQGVQSAIVAERAKAKALIEIQEDSIRDYNLRDIKDKQQREQRIAATKATEAAITANANEVIAQLQADEAMREQQRRLETADRLKDLEAKSTEERVRLQDELIDQGYERQGSAQRSHLAEAQQIEDEYQKAIRGIYQKYLQDNKTQSVNLLDPGVQASMAAAEQDRQSAQDLLKAKSAEDERTRGIEIKREQASVEGEIVRLRIEGLQQEAALGNGMAGIEARRLEIAEQFRQKREQIQRIEQDEKATAAQKLQAWILGLGLGSQEKLAQQLAAQEPIGGPAENIGGDHFGGTGEGLRKRESLEDQMLANSQKNTDLLQKGIDLLTNLVSNLPTNFLGLFGSGS